MQESFQNLGQYFRKLNHYTSLLAETHFERRKNKIMFFVILSIPFIFLEIYLGELNFMDVIPCFFWSLLGSWYRIVKYLKLSAMYIVEKHKNNI